VIDMKNASTQGKSRGRPRSFSRDVALGAAMRQFWQHGYEATSLNDLSRAMDLNPPSIYGAFGDKKALFEEAVIAYQKGPGCFAARALTEESVTRKAIERLLKDAAANFTSGKNPPGCMVVLSALNCTDEAADVRDALVQRRQQSARMIEERFKAARKSGEISANTDVTALANVFVTIFQGLSIRARDGATRKELEAVVQQAMKLWPEGNPE
jgi:AcrR family transcriptional regulator